MRVVFLDIDGVLYTVPAQIADYEAGRARFEDREFDHDSLVNLRRIVDTTGARIVLSSTWRGYDRSVDAVRRNLARVGLADAMIGETPGLRGGPCSVPRGQEIAAWLERTQEPVEAFVILDDDADMGELLPHLVQCNHKTGITDEIADQAIDILMAGPGGAKT